MRWQHVPAGLTLVRCLAHCHRRPTSLNLGNNGTSDKDVAGLREQPVIVARAAAPAAATTAAQLVDGSRPADAVALEVHVVDARSEPTVSTESTKTSS